MAELAIQATKRRPPKYRNTVIKAADGKTVLYRSAREKRRHEDLLLLERAGHIIELRREVPYVLALGVRIEGEDRKRPALRYVADFVYRDARTGTEVVEDAKGVRTEGYRIKKHLMATVHGISVKEV